MHHNHEYVDQALGDRFELVVQLLWGLRANFEYAHNISGNRLELAVPLATYSVEFTFTSLLVSFLFFVGKEKEVGAREVFLFDPASTVFKRFR